MFVDQASFIDLFLKVFRKNRYFVMMKSCDFNSICVFFAEINNFCGRCVLRTMFACLLSTDDRSSPETLIKMSCYCYYRS